MVTQFPGMMGGFNSPIMGGGIPMMGRPQMPVQGGIPNGFTPGFGPNSYQSIIGAPQPTGLPTLAQFQGPPSPQFGATYSNAYFPPNFPPNNGAADLAWSPPPGLSAAFSGNINSLIFGSLGVQPRIDDFTLPVTGPAFNTFTRPSYPFNGVLAIPGVVGQPQVFGPGNLGIPQGFGGGAPIGVPGGFPPQGFGGGAPIGVPGGFPPQGFGGGAPIGIPGGFPPQGFGGGAPIGVPGGFPPQGLGGGAPIGIPGGFPPPQGFGGMPPFMG